MAQSDIEQAVTDMVAAITRGILEAQGQPQEPTPEPVRVRTVGEIVKGSLVEKINRYTSGRDFYATPEGAADAIVETVLSALSPADRAAAESLLSRPQR